MITPVFTRLSRPETLGYPDQYRAEDESGAVIFQTVPASTNPNPVCIHPGKDYGKPWQDYAAQMLAGRYPYRVAWDEHHGLYLIINPVLCADGSFVGGKTPTTNNNVNHGGLPYAEGCLAHRGASDYNVAPYNRGSLCCLTIPNPYYKAAFTMYKVGDTGFLILQEGPHI